MGPPEAVLRQGLVGLGGEIAVGEKQQLNALAEIVFPEEQRIRW